MRTDARRRSPEGVGARGVFGAGKVKVNVWMVDAGWRVEAMTSTSRVNESCRTRSIAVTTVYYCKKTYFKSLG